jgi:hypothetical protein
MASGIAHGTQQRQRAGDIVEVVFLRIGDRFADQAGRREVHDRDNAMLCEGVIEHRPVREIARDKRSTDEATVSGREVIVDDRMIAGRGQRPAAMRADVARAAGDQKTRTIVRGSIHGSIPGSIPFSRATPGRRAKACSC